jgi:hypothetical protein
MLSAFNHSASVWEEAAEIESVLYITGLYTTVVQTENAFTAAFGLLLQQWMVKQFAPDSALLVIDLEAVDRTSTSRNVARIPLTAANQSAVGRECKARAFAEANARRSTTLTSAQLLTALLDARTKGLAHLSDTQKKQAKLELRSEYVKWGLGMFSKLNASVASTGKSAQAGGGAPAEGGADGKRKDRDWDTESEDESGFDDVLALEEARLTTEFKAVWKFWMDLEVPWALLFPSVNFDVAEANAFTALSRTMLLDMGRVFKWMRGEDVHLQIRGEDSIRVVPGLATPRMLGHIVPMSMAYTANKNAASYVERMNSAAKNILDSRRCGLGHEEIKMLTILRMNVGNSHLSVTDWHALAHHACALCRPGMIRRQRRAGR